VYSYRMPRYKSGWKPSFDFDFFKKPTIRDTGKGSASRYSAKNRNQAEEPQTYEDIKQQNLDEGTLWEDPDFPAEDSSIYFKDPPSVWPDIEWMRPSELCDDPQLFVGGATRMDVNQGILGDCWLLAAVASLATNEHLLHRVVPTDQSFSEDYAGVFRFQFWQYGRWVEVCVDDRLPCHDGKVIYMHSDERNEFWSALLEKAYAKLVGCYESLSGGLTSEALTDFTGGLVQRFTLRDETRDDLVKRMMRAKALGSLSGCSIDATPDTMESRLDNGLIIGHAYSITDVRMVDIETPRVSGTIPMIRVRNPWGNEHEWKGAFSDDSEEWNFIPEDAREEMGLTFSHDGEFWMTFDDFKSNFQRCEICYLGPDSGVEGLDEAAEEQINKWESTLCEGSWMRNVNAGGCKNYGSFYTNPQYKISIPEPDDDDEDGKCVVVVGVMQRARRNLKKVGQDNHTIGYAIYALPDPDAAGNLSHKFFAENPMAAKSSTFSNLREICDHHNLDPGDYVIVPSTFEPNSEANFIVRAYSEKPQSVQEMDDQASYSAEPDADELGDDDDDDNEKLEASRSKFLEDAGEDGEIDAYELRDLLNETFTQEFEFDGFSKDMCRSMVAMKDADLSGRLDYSDFASLLEDLKICKKAFRLYDTDGNGYFSSFEFKRVLNTMGLRMSNATFNATVMRYSVKEGHVVFDDFVACVVKLKTLFQTFKDKDEEESGSAEFKMDEYIQLSMYS